LGCFWNLYGAVVAATGVAVTGASVGTEKSDGTISYTGGFT
jgi:hypothetical protein